MSIAKLIADYSATVSRIAGYSREQMKESITRNKLNINKNLSTAEMRAQLFSVATEKANEAKAKIRAAAAAEERARKLERATVRAERKAEKRARKLERATVRAERKADIETRTKANAARKAERNMRFFITFRINYEVEVKVLESRVNPKTGKTIMDRTTKRAKMFPKIDPITNQEVIKTETVWGYFSAITRVKKPSREDVMIWAQEDMDRQDAKKAYKRVMKGAYQDSMLNVTLTPAQAERFDRLTGIKRDQSDYNEFQRLISELKLSGNVYREIYKINGFPDSLPQNGQCAVELLKSCGFKADKIDAWFTARYGVREERTAECNRISWKGKTLEEYRLLLENQRKCTEKAPANTKVDRAWSAQDIYDFAVEHDRSCYLLDRRNYCFHHYIGGSHKTAVYAMIEAEHVYPITDLSARRSIERKMCEVRSTKTSRGCITDNMRVDEDGKKRKPKKAKNPVKTVITHFAEVFKDGVLEPGIYYQTCGSLEHVVEQFLAHKIIPDVVYDSDTDSINCVKFEKTRVMIKPDYDDLKKTGFKSYSEIAYHFYEEMVQEHPDALGCVIGGAAKAKLWINEPVNDKDHVGIDFSKFYYHCAMKLTRDIPVYGTGSMIKCNRYVDDGSHYYVITDDITLFRGSDYYNCDLINLAIAEGIPFSVDHKLIACTKFKASILHKQLKKIVNCIGSLNLAKKAIVQFIGLLAKSKNRVSSSYLIPAGNGDGASVAYYYLDELARGKEVRLHGNRYPEAHLISAKKSWPLISNCGSIHREIICRSHMDVYLTDKRIRKENPDAVLVGVKTDCLIYRKNAISFENIAKFNTYHMPFKYECVRRMNVVEMVLPAVNCMVERRVEIKKESEFVSMDSLTEDVIDDIYCGGVVQVEGFAGTGKSCLIRRICSVFENHPRLEVLKFAPDNVSAANIEGKTMHCGFSLGCDTSSWKNRVKVRGLENKLILIDEISKADYNMISLIEFLSKHAYAVVLFGDCKHQCQPVLRCNIPVMDAIKSFVNVIYFLEVCKRGNDIMAPALEFFNTGSTKAYNRVRFHNMGDLADQFIAGGFSKLICVSNKERIAFNNAIVEKLSAGKETRTIKLRTHTTVRESIDIDVNLFVGMRLVCVGNAHLLGLIKTDTMIVESLNPLMVAVEHRNNGIEDNTPLRRISLENMQLSGFIDVGYAITSFKAQSGTYKFKHMILNMDKMKPQNGLVSATRTTCLDNLVIAERY